MLGFGGHLFTKSRRYSTTFKALRRARVDWTRQHAPARVRQLENNAADETVLVINSLRYAGIGWNNTGDALLANTSAALARERRRAGKDEIHAGLAI